MKSRYSRVRSKISEHGAIILVSVVLIGSGAAYAIASDGVTALFNTAIAVTGPDAICKNVTNASPTGLAEYIPTASAAEWQSFVAHPPSGVLLANCAPVCAGTSVGGFCWYLGATGASCDTVCASHGGCDITGTRDYAGSSGSDAQCWAVLSAFGKAVPGISGAGNPLGCWSWTPAGGGGVRNSSPVTTCSASNAVAARACACVR